MYVILNSLNAHSLLIFQPILMILASKFMVNRARSERDTQQLIIFFRSKQLFRNIYVAKEAGFIVFSLILSALSIAFHIQNCGILFKGKE